MPKAPSDLIAEARKRWQKCAEAEDAQRTRILLAKQFRAGDQWPAAIKLAREGAASIAGAPPQPARPCLVVDRLSQPVRQVSNTIKNADFGFDVLPNGSGADQETADILKGYLRRVQNQSRGESPIEWAADGAIEAGLGWFRLRTEYVHEVWEGEPNNPEAYDQELRLERITNSLTVYDDPSAVRPTRSDSKFRFLVEDMDKDEFLDTYEADLRGLDEFMSTGDMPGWLDKDTIRIAEYWRITYELLPIYLLEDGTGGTGEPPKGAKVKMRRVMRKPVVTGSKINAVEELKRKGSGGEVERWDWAGSRIPQIPVYGEELNVDGKIVLRGIISEGMDAQRMVNYTYSGAMEIFALAPKSPVIAAAGQLEPYKEIWQTANIYNHAYLPYDPISIAGEQVPMPARSPFDAPIMAAVELMRTSEEAIKATTSTGDASLGNSHPNERSGKALQALQSASDLANSNYPDNVRRALIYAAELMVEIIPKITRPGQILNIMGLDDEPDQVMVGKPFKKGPDGVPQEAPPDITPETAKMKESLFSFYDPTKGKYGTTVTLGKATATRREEGAAALGALIPNLPPEMAAVATPDYVRQLSFPGAQKIAERLEKALPPALQPQKEDGAQPDPQQLQQQIQQLEQQLQQAGEIIKTEQTKTQGQLQVAQMKAQTDSQAAQIDAQVKLEIARMDNATKLQLAEYTLRGAMMQSELDAREQQLGAAQERESQTSAQSHEAGMSAMGQVGDREAQERDQQAAREAQERQQQAERQSQEAGMTHEQQMAAEARAAAAEQGEAGA
jgi:hypothetical protein